MKRRHGFTLVELMVSMALIIFIMAILSQAFQAALGTFRDLKGQGDMAEKLRATTQILQNDLSADHFDGGRRLSDSNFWVNGPPTQGFFRIWQGSLGALEGRDPIGLGSYVSVDHFLAFTVNLHGNTMGDFMTASAIGSGNGIIGNVNLPGTVIPAFGPPESRYQLTSGVGAYNSQWGEVAWFLQPQYNPTSVNPATGGLLPDTTVADPTANTPPAQLYTLYRRQRLLVPDNNLIPLQPAGSNGIGLASFQEMSCWVAGNNVYFNNPTDITVPWRRFGMLTPNPNYLAYPAGLLYATQTYPPPQSQWPLTTPPTTSPWGTWTPPTVWTLGTPYTYPPSPVFPFLPASPNYPTMDQSTGVPVALYGTDIQLNDVISFDVRVYVPGFPDKTTGDPFTTLHTIIPSYNTSPNPQFYNTSATSPNLSAPAVFDTWTSVDDGIGNQFGSNYNYQTGWKSGGVASIPMWNGTTGPTIKAIQVTIRIWDFKTNQSRQVTIVQAM